MMKPDHFIIMLNLLIYLPSKVTNEYISGFMGLALNCCTLIEAEDEE